VLESRKIALHIKTRQTVETKLVITHFSPERVEGVTPPAPCFPPARNRALDRKKVHKNRFWLAG